MGFEALDMFRKIRSLHPCQYGHMANARWHTTFKLTAFASVDTVIGTVCWDLSCSVSQHVGPRR